MGRRGRKREVKGRNPVAYALALRGRGRVMKDRRAPRGGNRNEQAELMNEWRKETDDGNTSDR